MQKKQPKLRIGSDPEFVITQANLKLSTPDIFAAVFKEWDGSQIRVPDHGIIGKDHNSIAELRPEAEYSPLDHAAHIKALIEKCVNALPSLKLTTTSLWCPIGGHIHLEIPESFKAACEDVGATAIPKEIKQGLMLFAIPIMMGENKYNVAIRRNKSGGYGNITDIRVEDKGTAYTLEYRPLTAEWLTTEKTATAVLSYFSVVWNELITNPQVLQKIAPLVPIGNIGSLQNLISYPALLKPLVAEIRKHVRTFPLYETYKEHCELAMNPSEMNKLKEHVDFDMAAGWGFTNGNTNIPSLADAQDLTKIKEKIKNVSPALISSYQNIFWSNDRNTESMARAVGDTCYALNWKLRHQFYFFNLPEEFTEAVTFTGDRRVITGDEQIKTKADCKIFTDLVNETTAKILNHAKLNFKYADLKNGTSVRSIEFTFCIGMTQQMIETNDYKSLIKLVYDLESEKLSPKEIESYQDKTFPEKSRKFGAGALVKKASPEKEIHSAIIAGREIDYSTFEEINQVVATMDPDIYAPQLVTQHTAESEVLNTCSVQPEEQPAAAAA